MQKHTADRGVLEVAQVGTLVHTDECQTVINARGRDRKSRARAEREGVVHHNCSCCAQCRAAANQADSYRQAGHVTNQWQSSLKLSSSLHTACPCSSLIFPPSSLIQAQSWQSWLSHMLISTLYKSPELKADSSVFSQMWRSYPNCALCCSMMQGWCMQPVVLLTLKEQSDVSRH